MLRQICSLKVVGLTFGVGLAIAVSTITASATTVVLSDGTFTGATSVGTYDQNASLFSGAAVPVAPGFGDPAPSLQVNYTNNSSNPGSATSAVSFNDPNLSYFPATQGAIVSINASVDRDVRFFSGSAGVAINNTPSFRILIEQCGASCFFYLATVAATPFSGTTASNGTSNVYETGWMHLTATGLTANMFDSYNPSTFSTNSSFHPNFDGPTMTFGLVSASNRTGGVGTIRANFDNLEIDLVTQNTPLPAALPLFAGGLGVIGLLGWRRRRKAAAIAA